MVEDFGSIVLNDVTIHGLRRVHVMRTGKRVDPSTWAYLVPVEGDESLEYISLQDRELPGTWHMWMIWHVHERITFNRVNGVMWYIEKSSKKVSDDIDDAMMRFLLEFEKWPEKVEIYSKPKDAPYSLEWNDEKGSHVVKLEENNKLPVRCIFVPVTPLTVPSIPTPPDPQTVMGLRTPSPLERVQS